MKFGTAIVITTAFMMSAPSAEAKRDKNNARQAKAQAPVAMSSHGPARMIELRPGYWISSYGCAHDAGYGRFAPCDLTDGNAR